MCDVFENEQKKCKKKKRYRKSAYTQDDGCLLFSYKYRDESMCKEM